jgi:DNA repair protein RadC
MATNVMRVSVYSVKLVRSGTATYQVGCDREAARVAREILADSVGEKFIVMYLDGCNRVTGVEVVSQGGLHGCGILAADVFRGALLHRAAAIVVAHNHPSGDPTPSREDIVMTATLEKAGELLGVPVLDHVIVTDVTHSSLRELGFFPKGNV